MFERLSHPDNSITLLSLFVILLGSSPYVNVAVLKDDRDDENQMRWLFFVIWRRTTMELFYLVLSLLAAVLAVVANALPIYESYRKRKKSKHI